MINELVLSKFQQLLGVKYKVMLGNTFNRTYTNAKDIDWNAFERDKDVIVTVLRMDAKGYNKAPFISYNTNYTLEFWTPVDDLMKDKNGDLLEVPAFNVFADLETLKTQLSGIVTLGSGATAMKAVLTYSGPEIGQAYDPSAVYKRMVVTLRGLINITDKGTFTQERVVKIGITTGGTTTYYAIDGLISRKISATREGESSQKQGTKLIDIYAQSTTNSIALAFDDFDTTNPAKLKLIAIAEGGDLTTELPVQIYMGATKKAEYNALVDCSIIGDLGNTGIERVEATFRRLS